MESSALVIWLRTTRFSEPAVSLIDDKGNCTHRFARLSHSRSVVGLNEGSLAAMAMMESRVVSLSAVRVTKQKVLVGASGAPGGPGITR